MIVQTYLNGKLVKEYEHEDADKMMHIWRLGYKYILLGLFGKKIEVGFVAKDQTK